MRSIDRYLTRSRIHDSFIFQDTATSEISTLSLHDALPISSVTASPGLLLFCGSSPCFASEINVVSAYPSGQISVFCKQHNCFRATLLVDDAKGEALSGVFLARLIDSRNSLARS